MVEAGGVANFAPIKNVTCWIQAIFRFDSSSTRFDVCKFLVPKSIKRVKHHLPSGGGSRQHRTACLPGNPTRQILIHFYPELLHEKSRPGGMPEANRKVERSHVDVLNV